MGFRGCCDVEDRGTQGFTRTKTEIESVFLVLTERMYSFLLLDYKRLWRCSYALKCPRFFSPLLRPVVVCSCLFKGLYLYDLFSRELEQGRPFPMSRRNQCTDTKCAIQSRKVNLPLTGTTATLQQ